MKLVVMETKVGVYRVVTEFRTEPFASQVTHLLRGEEGIETHLHGAHEVVCCEARILEAQRIAEELGTPEALEELHRVEEAETARGDAEWSAFFR